MNHEERCRELAELTEWDARPEEKKWCACLGDSGLQCAHEPRCRCWCAHSRLSSPLDQRFASLRGEHDLYSGNYTCYNCMDSKSPYCLRTGGDELDEAIAACGGEVIWFGKDDDPEGTWLIRIVRLPFGDKVIVEGRGSTPKEAKSAALHQAIFG